MEEQDTQIARKRKINDMEHERSEDRGETNEENGEEESEMNFSGSEEMRLGIARLHEKVEAYNQLVSEMLESGKSLFNKLSQDYEERVLMIHKEQIEKWQEEIKELRVIDATNEEMNDRLNNVKCLLQTVHIGQ
ncbi:uncharacterized protein LOC110736233 [Chenopodium quinoa]|nr:uncharacterized protein LOC110736233 [Chenopodium quinoa]XP_021772098.1 uncharacterized protein LOC110736233 [Chenopodium quinoa]XP_021772099.1 uncharacterized protein LOC110736233 [Chenopodium quinoa]